MRATESARSENARNLSRFFNESGYIPRSRHNPKILGVDDAEIVGDRITEFRPIPRNLFMQETERRIGELGASYVALVVRDMLVHHLSLIHISEPTRLGMISYAVFCLKKKK